jgi:nucleotidyltransferase/DNA polymerase involved in DNA repair
MSGYGAAASRTQTTLEDRGVGKASFRSHRADRPVRRIGRRRTQRPLDHGSDLIVVDASGAARAGLVKQAIAAILQKSAAPLANGVFVEAEFGSYRLARQAIRTSQDRAASLR